MLIDTYVYFVSYTRSYRVLTDYRNKEITLGYSLDVIDNNKGITLLENTITETEGDAIITVINYKFKQSYNKENRENTLRRKEEQNG